MREPTNVMLLMRRVVALRKPFMMKPARIHLISDIPDPAAYGAHLRTMKAAEKAKRTA